MWDNEKIKFKRTESRWCDLLTAMEVTFNQSPTAVAFALWWDDCKATVYCPFCSNNHEHHMSFFAGDKSTSSFRLVQDECGRYTFNGLSPDFNCVRRAGCGSDAGLFDLGYVILFPFQEDERVRDLSFELETLKKKDIYGFSKVLHRFRTVGLDVSELAMLPKVEASKDKSEDLESALAGLSLTAESLDFAVQSVDTGVGGRVEKKASTSLFEFIDIGDVQSIKAILRASPAPDQTLHVLRDKTGQTPLHRAAAKGNPDVVEVLLGHKGRQLNALDKKGRTPLMEASFWGCIQTVNKLIRAGVDKDIKDRQGLRAIDLAEESERNDEERHDRYALGYLEDPFVKKRHRKLIRGMLKPQHPKRSESRMIQDDLTEAYFYRSFSTGTKTISFIVPARGIRIANQYKTVAFLHRGHPFPVVAAVSGWTEHLEELGASKTDFERLNASVWVNEVFKVASKLGFVFEPDPGRDQDYPGRFKACHAETQLMAYYVNKNYLFRDYREGDVIDDDFLQLCRSIPRPKRKPPQIIVSQQPCVSCQMFAARIRATLGFDFEFVAPVVG